MPSDSDISSYPQRENEKERSVFMNELIKRFLNIEPVEAATKIIKELANLPGEVDYLLIDFFKAIGSRQDCSNLRTEIYNLMLGGNRDALAIAARVPNQIDGSVLSTVKDKYDAIFFLLQGGRHKYSEKLQELDVTTIVDKVLPYSNHELLSAICQQFSNDLKGLRQICGKLEQSNMNLDLEPLIKAIEKAVTNSSVLDKSDEKYFHDFCMRISAMPDEALRKKAEELLKKIKNESLEAKLIDEIITGKQKDSDFKGLDVDALVKLLENKSTISIVRFCQNSMANAEFFESFVNAAGIYLKEKTKSKKLWIIPFLHPNLFGKQTLKTVNDKVRSLPVNTLRDIVNEVHDEETIFKILDILKSKKNTGDAGDAIVSILTEKGLSSWLWDNGEYLNELLIKQPASLAKLIPLMASKPGKQKEMFLKLMVTESVPESLIYETVKEIAAGISEPDMKELWKKAGDRYKPVISKALKETGSSTITDNISEAELLTKADIFELLHEVSDILPQADKTEQLRLKEWVLSRARLWLLEYDSALNNEEKWNRDVVESHKGQFVSFLRLVDNVELADRLLTDIALWSSLSERAIGLLTDAILEVLDASRSSSALLGVYRLAKAFKNDRLLEIWLKKVSHSIIAQNFEDKELIRNLADDPNILAYFCKSVTYWARYYRGEAEKKNEEIKQKRDEILRKIARQIKIPMGELESSVISLARSQRSAAEVAEAVAKKIKELRKEMTLVGLFPVEAIDNWGQEVSFDADKHKSKSPETGTVLVKSLGIRLSEGADDPIVDYALVMSDNK